MSRRLGFVFENRTQNPEDVFENSTRLPETKQFSGAFRLICESVFDDSTRFPRTCLKIEHLGEVAGRKADTEPGQDGRISSTLRLSSENVFENGARLSKPVFEFRTGTIKSRLICRVIGVRCPKIEHVTETCDRRHTPDSLADRSDWLTG